MKLDENVIKQIADVTINVSETDVFDRIRDRYRWPYEYPYDKESQPSIECINADGTTHRNFFKKDGWVDSDKVIDLYLEGHTLILSRVHMLFPELTKISLLIANSFGKEVNGNAYFSKGKKSVSFDYHSHHYPVLVKNVFGISKWVVKDEEIIMRDQGVLYFEADIMHMVTEILQPKLSVTFNII